MKPLQSNVIQIIIPVCGLLIMAAISQEARPTTSPTPTPTPTPVATPAATPLPEMIASPTPTPTPTPTSAAESEEKKIANDPVKAAEQIDSTTPTLTTQPAYPDVVDNTGTTLPEEKPRPFGAQPASPANGVTLDQVVETALQKNADILKQLAEIKRTRGVVVEVRAQALPTIAASSSYNQTDPNETNRGNKSTTSSSTTTGTAFIDGQSVPATFNFLGQPVNGTAELPGQTVPVTLTSQSSSSTLTSVSDKSWRLSFAYDQTLYSGGRIQAGITQAKILEDSAFYQLRDTVDLVIDNVRKQFYVVLLNRALIEVQEESVQLLKSELEDQKNRFEAGTVPRFNVLRAEVALANAQPPLIQAKNNYRTAQLELAKLAGISWPVTNDLTPFPVKGVLVYTPRKVDLGAAVETAKERRAFLKVQRQTILAEVQGIKIALGGYLPTITANVGWEFRNDPSASDFEEQIDGWFFGFSGTWNIFDGLATHGRVLQAKARLESAKVNYDDSVRQVELEVQTSYSKIQEARELIESQQKTVEQAEEALRLARERFAAGAGTQLDVLDARVSLTQAQTTAIQALSDYNTALADFDRVTGTSTVYHETFNDPMSDPKIRKKWFAKNSRHTKNAPLSDAEIQANLLKRQKESKDSRGD